MGEQVAALRANDSGLFRQWVAGGIQDLGEEVVEELLLDLLYSFLTAEEQDRLTGEHLSTNFLTNNRPVSKDPKSTFLQQAIPSPCKYFWLEGRNSD